MFIRFAKENELIQINELRKQVNDLHVEGKTEVLRLVLIRSYKIIYILFGKIQNRKSCSGIGRDNMWFCCTSSYS